MALKSSFIFKRLMTILSLSSILILFQNCGISDENTDQALSEYEDSRAQSLPFAFDVTLDHIAYMSCEGENLKASGTFFNFKAGAYNDDEGLKFSENFFSSSAVGALGGNKDQLISYLGSSNRNRGSGLVMSIRESGELRVPVALGDANPENSLAPILWDLSGNVQLTEERIAGLLYDNPEGVNYLKGLPGVSPKSVEGELSYDLLGAQQTIRNTLEGSGYLSFTFGTEDLEKPGMLARSPNDLTGASDSAKSSVFGKGYSLNFGQFDSGRLSSRRVVVTGITGVNLQNDAVTLDESWVCPPNERYVIIKDAADAGRRYDGGPATIDHDNDSNTAAIPNNPWNVDDPGTAGDESYDDGGKGVGGYYVDYLKVDTFDEDNDGDDTESVSLRHKVLCPMIPDEMISGQSEHTDQAWKRIRNLLPEDEWYVYRGDRYNCIVPKKNDNLCYGKVNENTSNPPPVLQYFASEDFIDQQLQDEKTFQEDTSKPKPERDVVTDCEASPGQSGSNRLCPHILSVCYKL